MQTKIHLRGGGMTTISIRGMLLCPTFGEFSNVDLQLYLREVTGGSVYSNIAVILYSCNNHTLYSCMLTKKV